jgi:parallel beta-helix repeat protein
MKRTYGIYGIVLLSLLAGIRLVSAQELPSGETQIPQMPGSIEGNGTHFEITDSGYLNVTLDSTAEIQLRLESIPRAVILHVKSASGAASTCITLGGFPASTIFYKYEDDYHNKEVITTDASGRYTYEQDISTPHLVFIQPDKSTIYFTADGLRDELGESVGTWDPVEKIATLTQDLAETIQIQSDGVTLDGGGHTITGTGLMSGVYLWGTTGVTIRNLTVREFQCGIFLNMSDSNVIEDSNVISNVYGIRLYNLSNSNILTGNTASSNHYGIHLFASDSNQIYNNNFIDNITQAYVWDGEDNEFYQPLPTGGNYWSDCTDPDDDGDGFVDFAYVFDYGQQDGLPWVNQDGWGNVPPIAEAGPDQTVIIGESVQFDGSSSSDPDGIIASYQWEFGDLTPAGHGVVFIHAYSVEGTYTVTLTVTDDDGVTGTDTATVTVLTPAEAINEVAGIVEDMDLDQGVDNNLSTKLGAAQDALDAENAEQRSDAISKLEAFINTVEAQRGKKLTDEQADELVDYASKIILTLAGEDAAPSFASSLPQTACLLLAYPMPANPDIWIPYQLGTDSNVVIRIHDLSGHLVRTFDLGHQPAGHYTSKDRAAYWDGKNEIGEEVASGIYFYSISADQFSATKKMVIAR